MAPVPAVVAELLAGFSFPKPDQPDNPESSTTLTVKDTRTIRALLSLILEYIRTEYAKCGQKTAAPLVP